MKGREETAVRRSASNLYSGQTPELSPSPQSVFENGSGGVSGLPGSLGGVGGEAAEHEVDHRQIDESLARLGVDFEVLGEPAAVGQPGERALHHPATRLDDEAVLVGRLPHDPELPPEARLCLGHAGGEAGVDPAGGHARAGRLRHPAQVQQAIPVLHLRTQDDHPQQQPVRIDGDEALRPLHLLAGVVADIPPFSVAFTDWLSMISADGSGSRPECSRVRRRSASWIRTSVPSSVHFAKYQYTVLKLGKSCGSARQRQPSRSTYRIALTTSRSSTSGGRPRPSARRGRAINGSRIAHWASVTSLGYGRRSSISRPYPPTVHNSNTLSAPSTSSPPPTMRTISTVSPSRIIVDSCSSLRSTSPLWATAIRGKVISSRRRSSGSAKFPSNSRRLPLTVIAIMSL